MNQIPQYRFTLTSDELDPNFKELGIISGGDPYWVNQLPVGSNTIVWTGGGVNPIAAVGAGAAGTVQIAKHLVFDIGFEYDVLIYYTSITDSMLVISTMGGGQIQYTGIYKASPKQILVRFKIKAYAGIQNDIFVQAFTINRVIGSINVRFSQFYVRKLRGNTRVVVPGNFKNVSIIAERSLTYFGFGRYLTGSILLAGEDWRYVRNQLIDFPSQQIYCTVELDSGSGLGFQQLAEPVALDTLTLISRGLSYTYSADVAFLKSSEWNRFTNYLPVASDLKPVGLDGYDTLDSRGWTRILANSDGLDVNYPTIQKKFEGKAMPTIVPVAFNARQIMYLGFGIDVIRNDGFKTSQGFNNEGSFEVEWGGFYSLTATITVDYSTTGAMSVQYLGPGNVWTGLPDNVPTVITLNSPTFGLRGSSIWFGVRIAETSNGTGTINIVSGSIVMTANVMYPVNFIGTSVNPTIKALLSNISGNESVWNNPLFNDSYASSGFQYGNTLQGQTMGLTNPPLKQRAFNEITTLPFPANTIALRYNIGNIWQGQLVNWVRATVAPFTISYNGVGVSNLLAFSNTRVGYEYPYYNPDWFMRHPNHVVNGALGTVVGTVSLKLYGVVGFDKYLLFDYGIKTTGGSLGIVGLSTIDRDYEFLALEANCQSVGASVAITDFGMGSAANLPVEGALSGNYFMKGNNVLNYSSTIGQSRLTEMRERSQICYSPTGDLLEGICKVFGLGIIPQLTSTGKLILNVTELDNLLLNTINPVQLNVQHYNLELDQDLVRTIIKVGGPIRDLEPSDGYAACGNSSYSSEYVTARTEQMDMRELTFALVINQPLIVNRELSDTQTGMINCILSVGLGWAYRLLEGVTVIDTPSPRQINWAYTEGRIVRKNISLLSSMGSRTFSFISGNASAIARTDYPPDGYGSIADEDLVIGNRRFTPWKATFETDMPLDEYKIFDSGDNIYRTVNASPDGVIQVPTYIRGYSYNPATGKLNIVLWLKNYDPRML